MAKSLSGAELAGYIKERQAKQVRALRQAYKIFPKLAILMTPSANNVIGAYVRGKQVYANDILIEVVVEVCEQSQMIETIERYNADDAVQGIIVQLPLDNAGQTDEIMNTIAPQKDVDGLGEQAVYNSATADAINWLCGGYGVDLQHGRVVVIGRGRLVGKPLFKMWRNAGYDVTSLDVDTKDNTEILSRANVIVSAAGVPRLVTSNNVKQGATVIDAGTTSENGAVVGDVADDVRARADVSITPKIGGVGPLTIALLFDHVIQACQKQVS